jgi:hypothetical protein
MKANQPTQFQTCPQCTAKSKRTKQRCKAPAVKGWKVCRFHGARGGAPRGAGHGNYKSGLHTIEAKANRAQLSNLILDAKAHCALVEQEFAKERP